MRIRARIVSVMALAALAAAGCGKIAAINQPVPRGAADFRTYIALGTSITAGFESGGLVVHHQNVDLRRRRQSSVCAALDCHPATPASGLP